MNVVDKTVSDIKTLEIQGATSIAKAALVALKESDGDIKDEVGRLVEARCTEPMLVNCLNYVSENGRESVDSLLTVIDDGREKIINLGMDLVKKRMKILTYCHSLTVVLVLTKYIKTGVDLEVVVCETRPLYQGRITAKELVGKGIKTVMAVDGAAGYLLGLGGFDGVFLGADVFTGDCFYNKIGSYPVSLAASANNVPVYVFGSLLKFTCKDVEVERRDPSEIWREKPSGLAVVNPAFDKTPYKYVEKVVTEFGILGTDELGKKAVENYKFIK